MQMKQEPRARMDLVITSKDASRRLFIVLLAPVLQATVVVEHSGVLENNNSTFKEEWAGLGNFCDMNFRK